MDEEDGMEKNRAYLRMIHAHRLGPVICSQLQEWHKVKDLGNGNCHDEGVSHRRSNKCELLEQLLPIVLDQTACSRHQFPFSKKESVDRPGTLVFTPSRAMI